MKPLHATIQEVLLDAIRSEVESRLFYRQLAEHASTPEARKKLLDLSDDEILHRAKLERKYRDLVGEAPPDPEPVTAVELPPELRGLDLRRALQIALEHERKSESDYRFLAERVPNTPLGRLYLELAELEWNHKSQIEAEVIGLGEADDLFPEI